MTFPLASARALAQCLVDRGQVAAPDLPLGLLCAQFAFSAEKRRGPS
jgi:hypothetical protein